MSNTRKNAAYATIQYATYPNEPTKMQQRYVHAFYHADMR